MEKINKYKLKQTKEQVKEEYVKLANQRLNQDVLITSESSASDKEKKSKWRKKRLSENYSH